MFQNTRLSTIFLAGRESISGVWHGVAWQSLLLSLSLSLSLKLIFLRLRLRRRRCPLQLHLPKSDLVFFRSSLFVIDNAKKPETESSERAGVAERATENRLR